MSADIDIDFKDRKLALELFPHIPAMMVNKGVATKHNTGVYFQNIPTNPLTGLASIPYAQADSLGYFKVDFLNNTIYEKVRDEAHLRELVDREPIWSLLEDQHVVSLLAHIGNHFNIVQTIKPQSIEDLAVVLALIRPGKGWLVNEPRSVIDAEIWLPPSDGTYHFKRSHSFAYGLSIAVQLNILVEQAL